MDEVRRRDIKVYIAELFSVKRLIAFSVLFLVTWGMWEGTSASKPLIALFLAITLLAMAYTSYHSSIKKRFLNMKLRLQWESVLDRLERFETAVKGLSKAKVATLEELPVTIEQVAESLYYGLRRADIVAHEVAASEGWLAAHPKVRGALSADQQAQELYRIADKNIAEYRQHFQAVMNAVERTEAQVAVFNTTLDTLRMKMLGYRLATKEIEAPTHEFLSALAEAKMQLDAIDKTLDELELAPFPRTISILPEPPDQEQQQLNAD